MVHIPIQDRDSPNVRMVEGAQRSHHNIVEETKAHSYSMPRMMPRGPHVAEGTVVLSLQHAIDSITHGSGREGCRVKRMLIDVGVRIDLSSSKGGQSLDSFDIRRIVHPFEKRSVHNRGSDEDKLLALAFESFTDGSMTRGALGMTLRPLMPVELR
jgi:hypothetical protein